MLRFYRRSDRASSRECWATSPKSEMPSARPSRPRPRGTPAVDPSLNRIYCVYTAKVSKVLIVIPDDLLRQIDREATRRGTTRSALLRQAARHELGWPDPAEIDAALLRGRTALRKAGSFDSTALVRTGRDERDELDRGR
ncbi:MAG: ribbon-helix-helix protein, CopG family [Candidatus Dormibacteraceae bacterium]